MTESSPDEGSAGRKDFICGVVEGFYGRPWTTEQRKDLFQKLKKWGLDMYVYAPKDDYKHRAYWRELYTVEEAEHLTSLISAARAQGITFCYALSPGLDITYSSQKEITTLKRKLEQVSQFGCTCFALLFDDIEPEMSEADKQIFQSFAHAQVSVTNEIHQHLGCPRFLLCPTQYCSTRAVPTVNSSEYLNTLGTKLSQQIDIMWTGPKVISKVLTTECIEEITAVLRRAPVIWDNLHANDYDQKRIFLGPYCGRSPELIPLLRGVLTNPNCEYNANMIAIRTLAHWASCSLDAPTHMEAVSWDIRLESESEQGVCEDEVPLTLGKHVYHPRQALRLAIKEWLPEFSIPKTAQGPVIKPQPPVTVPPVPILPILPSVNTCMSLQTATTTTTTTAAAAIPTVSAHQLLADCPHAAVSPAENFSSVSNPVMNSLVSPTKVILNESIQNPIIPMAANIALPNEIPVSSLPVPILGLKVLDENVEKNEDHSMEGGQDKNDSVANDSVLETASFIEEMKKEEKDDQDTIIVDDEKNEEHQRNGEMSLGDTPQTLSPSRPSLPEGEPLDVDPPSATTTDTDVVMNDQLSENGSMQVEPSNSPLSTDMMVESVDATEPSDDPAEESSIDSNALTEDDLVLLCDLFYLPFEHGSRGLRMLHDFHWLTGHAAGMLPRGNKPETSEWRRRRSRFAWWAGRARRLLRRLEASANRELHAELQPYAWELAAVLALLDGLVRWLGERGGGARRLLRRLEASANRELHAELQPYAWELAAVLALLDGLVRWLGERGGGARRLLRRLEASANRELHAELQPYAWELAAVLALLDGLVRWLGERGGGARRLLRRLEASANRELHAELQPYAWELAAVLALLDGLVRWLGERGGGARRLLRRLEASANRELHAELQPYAWELAAVLALLDGLVRWLGERGGGARRLLRRLEASANRELHAELQPYAWELAAVLALLDGLVRWLGERGGGARRLLRRLEASANRELHAELQPYAWELAAVLALLDGLVRWLELGKFPQNIAANTQGSYTWFSKGWREAFESGAQEPWVFRGGLTADLRRLLPVECSGDALRPTVIPSEPPFTVRPYIPSDEEAVCAICHKTCRDGSDCSDLFPSDLQTLPADRLVQPFLTLVPSLCMVIEEDEQYVRVEDGAEEVVVNGVKPGIVGYACAALNSKEFYKKQEVAWIPEMCKKYPEQLTEREDLSQAAKECIRHFHQFSASERAPECVTRAHPALLTCCVLPSCRDPHAPARLLTCLLAALRAHGASGVHACINATDHYLQQFYSRLGFAEVSRSGARVFLARAF